MNAQPVIIDTHAGACTGWFHPAAGFSRSASVLLCPPLGYEELCAHAAYAQIAMSLASAGFDVLRFHYHGMGDSAGGDADPNRVQAWLQSIDGAAEHLQQLSGARQLAFLGMRLGATLAVEAAVRRGGVDSLVLWAPCATGRSFVREMRAANAGRAADHAGEGGLEALGSLFTAQTLESISQLDASGSGAAPAPRVLVIGRDDLPADGPLPAKYRGLGAAVTCTRWAGYADMMSEPHEARIAPAALGELIEWLQATHPEKELTARAAEAQRPWPQGFTAGSVHECPVGIRSHTPLFGVVSEPAAPSRHDETAVLMLNVGGNYHVGCNRIYVKAARELANAGYRVLRFDVSGIGDSHDDRASVDTLYRHQSMGDVSAAMDLMAERGCKRFWLLGICSGSYLAFETALLDSRVTGQILLNSRLLEWDNAQGPWQTSMQQHYKSTRYYRKALLRGEAYARLLRGQVDVLGIARRLWTLAAARARRSIDGLLRRAPQHGVLAKMRHLCARGVDSFVVMSAEDDGLDYIEFHLGSGGARMKGHPSFRMALIEDSDHTFSTVSSQRAVIGMVREHLDSRHEIEIQATPAPHAFAY